MCRTLRSEAVAQEAYIRAVCKLAAFLRRSPDTAPSRICGGSSLYLVDQGTSPITLNATLTGLKFFFEVTVDDPRTDGQDGPGAWRRWTRPRIEPPGGYQAMRGQIPKAGSRRL